MTNSTNCRFFISDLPANSKESDLERIFCNYGQIEKVELKCKENLVDPDDVKIIAFVTLKVDKNQAQYCKFPHLLFELHPLKRKCSYSYL